MTNLLNRLLPLVLIAIAIYMLAVVGMNQLARHERASGGMPPAVLEFTPTYGGALQLQSEPIARLYQRQPMMEFTARAVVEQYPLVDRLWLELLRYPPWMYPPHFFPLIMPLALLPFWWAYVAWLLVTALPYLLAIVRQLPHPFALPLALAMPPAFYNTIHGQTGFLTAGLLWLGLLSIGKRPWLAGLLFALLTVKPHLGLLLPVALAAAGCWRVIGWTLLHLLLLLGSTTLFAGPEVWTAYLNALSLQLYSFESGVISPIPMTSLLAFASTSGIDQQLARWLQFAAMGVAVVLVAHVWWHSSESEQSIGYRNAIFALATPFALPMVYNYDLVLVVPAAGWLLLELLRRGGEWWEWPLLLLASTAMMLPVTIADRYGLQPGIIPPTLMLIHALIRWQRSRAEERPHQVTEATHGRV